MKYAMDKKKVKLNIRVILTVLIIIIAFCYMITNNILLKNKTKELEKENIELKEEIDVVVDLEECPLCGGTAKLCPVNDSFYIKCENCKLETNFYTSKKYLVDYWNCRTFE